VTTQTKCAVILIISGIVSLSLAGCGVHASTPDLPVAQMMSLAADANAAVAFFSDMSDVETEHIYESGTRVGSAIDVPVAASVKQTLDQQWPDNGEAAGRALVAAVCPQNEADISPAQAQIGSQVVVLVAARKQASHEWAPLDGIARAVTQIIVCNMPSLFDAAPRTSLGNTSKATNPAVELSGQGRQGANGHWLLSTNAVVLGTAMQAIAATTLDTGTLLAAWQRYLTVFLPESVGSDKDSIDALYLHRSSSPALAAANVTGCTLSFIVDNAMAGIQPNDPRSIAVRQSMEAAGLNGISVAYSAYIQVLADAGYFAATTVQTLNDEYPALSIPHPPPGLQPGVEVDLDAPGVADWLVTSGIAIADNIISSANPGLQSDARFVAPLP